jgi:glyoxylase-like metal-dependent hydrolase (beta-lactamase superfamily II)
MQLGDFELTLINDGTFKLDGGTMFGMVPKVLWEKVISPDKNNRITLGKNCFFIKTPKDNILIETGMGGSKISDKGRSIYEIDDEDNLSSGLAKNGLKPEDIDIVILSHLHFDHAGGNTILDRHNNFIPVFPNARYIIQRGEWEAAINPNELTRRSYLAENLLPLKKYKLLELVEGDKEIIKGIKVKVTGGHTRYHQIISIQSKKEKAFFLGDLMPSTFHLKVPYITSYDAYPLELVKVKKEIIKRAVKEKVLLLWYHDPEISIGFLEQDRNGKITIQTSF